MSTAYQDHGSSFIYMGEHKPPSDEEKKDMLRRQNASDWKIAKSLFHRRISIAHKLAHFTVVALLYLPNANKERNHRRSTRPPYFPYPPLAKWR